MFFLIINKAGPARNCGFRCETAEILFLYTIIVYNEKVF